MLCSKCYKKIPKGEEVQQASSVVWRAGWTGGGYGSEIVCRRCSIKIKKRNRYFFIIFITLFLIMFTVILGVTIVLIINKNG